VPQDTELLRLLVSDQRELRRELTAFARRQLAILEGEIDEDSSQTANPPPLAGGVVTDTWPAQISGISVITGIFVVVPAGSTGVTLTLGRISFPIQNTTELLTPVLFKTFDQTRKLVYTAAASGTQLPSAFVKVWGFAVPSQAVIH
jgi:hypothetical protein